MRQADEGVAMEGVVSSTCIIESVYRLDACHIDYAQLETVIPQTTLPIDLLRKSNKRLSVCDWVVDWGFELCDDFNQNFNEFIFGRSNDSD